MLVNLFFLSEKIIAHGSGLRDAVDLETSVPQLYSGVFVRRGEIISLNKFVEAEIYRIYHSSLTNQTRRMYQVLDIREPEALELLIERIKGDSTLEKLDSMNRDTSYAWLRMLNNGIYNEIPEGQSLALDWLLYHKLWEYDNEGYYSMALKWVTNLQYGSKTLISRKDATETMGCKQADVLDAIMAKLGYTNTDESFRRVVAKEKKEYLYGIWKNEGT